MHMRNGDPVTAQLAWANRRLLAERLDWPEGALEACEDIEPRHPGWSLFWAPANTVPGFEKAAGYWAIRHGMHEAERFAATPAELEQAIQDAPPAEHDYSVEGCAVCAAAYEDRLRRAGL